MSWLKQSICLMLDFRRSQSQRVLAFFLPVLLWVVPILLTVVLVLFSVLPLFLFMPPDSVAKTAQSAIQAGTSPARQSEMSLAQTGTSLAQEGNVSHFRLLTKKAAPHLPQGLPASPLPRGAREKNAAPDSISTFKLITVAQAGGTSPAQAERGPLTRPGMVLNQDWEVAEAPDLDYAAYCSQWQTLAWKRIGRLPLIQHYREPNHCAWYRKKFSLDNRLLSAEGKGKSLRLTFTDVRHLARIYLNGRLAGEHFGGYLPFSLECGHLLQTGENELVVGVQDWTSAISAEAIGAGKYQGQGQGYGSSSGNINPLREAQGIPAGDYAVPSYPGFPEPGTIIAPIGSSHRRAGICGQVYLEAIPDIRIGEVIIEPKLDQHKIRVKVGIEANLTGGGQRAAKPDGKADEKGENNHHPHPASLLKGEESNGGSLLKGNVINLEQRFSSSPRPSPLKRDSECSHTRWGISERKPLTVTFWLREVGLLNEAGAGKHRTPQYRKIGQATVEQFEQNLQGEQYVQAAEGQTWLIFEAELENAQLWDLDHPFLYQMKVTLQEGTGQGKSLDEGKSPNQGKGVAENVIDEMEVRYGLRDWRTEGPYFILNGDRINLKAASIIYDNSLTEDELRRRIHHLKEAHINHLRFHSEPPPPFILDVCDEEGMLVTVESAIYGSYVGRYDTSFTSEFWQHAREHWQGLVRRDRNHPCVIIWCIENESVEYDAGRGGEVRFMELGMEVRRLDPQRPIMYEGGMDCFGLGDIINLHYPHEFPFWNCLPNDAWWLEQAKGGGSRKGKKKAAPAAGGEAVDRSAVAGDEPMDRSSVIGEDTVGGNAIAGDGSAVWNARAYDVCLQEEWPKRDWEGKGIYLDSLWRWQPEYRFCWKKDKPLYLGEELYLPTTTPDPYTILIGDDAYTSKDWRADKDQGQGQMESQQRHQEQQQWQRQEERKGAVWRYYLEAYRQAGVSGVCPWVITGEERKDNPLYRACQESFQPVAVFIKEHNNRFWEDEEVTRTVTVCNDERRDRSKGFPLESLPLKYLSPVGDNRQAGDAFILEWQVVSSSPASDSGTDKSGIACIAQGRQTFLLPPGHRKATAMRFKIPKVTQPGLQRERWQLQVKVSKNGRIRDEKSWDIWGYRKDVGKIANTLCGTPIFLYDPDGTTAEVLTRAGVKYQRIEPDGSHFPLIERKVDNNHPPHPTSPATSEAGLLILGRNAFSCLEGKKTSIGVKPPWQEQIDRFVSRGGVLIAFEQEFLPAWLPGGITANALHHSTMAFPGRCGHPLLNEEMTAENLRFWGSDNFISRYDLNLPESGNYRSIVDSGGMGGLIYSPLLEITRQEGAMIFCQMLAIKKWEPEPMARVLLKNILSYAAEKARAKSSPYQVAAQEQERIETRSSRSGTSSSIRVGGIFGRGENIMVFDGQGANWEHFGQDRDEILAFVKAGGKVLLREIDEESIRWVQKVLPVDLKKIQPEEMPVGVRERDVAAPANWPGNFRAVYLALYNRDVYWVEPHSEFRYDRADFDRGIADYALEVQDATNDGDGDIGNRDFRVISWTRPNVLIELDYGQGFFLIDQVKWPAEWARGGFNEARAKRYASSVLHYLGVTMQEKKAPAEEILIQAENMSCRTPGQPLIRCRSHDYWTLCSNNYISDTVYFGAPGEYAFTVRAKCRRPDSPPVMVLTIDGLTAGMQVVPSLSWDSFRFAAWVEEGEHEVSLSLVNAENPYGEKYLYVDWLRIGNTP
ncbi:MAG: glycoside hydrolase family 2 TIM barrel-domain containing protein [bacterium]